MILLLNDPITDAITFSQALGCMPITHGLHVGAVEPETVGFRGLTPRPASRMFRPPERPIRRARAHQDGRPIPRFRFGVR